MTHSEQRRSEIVVGLVATPRTTRLGWLRGSPLSWPVSSPSGWTRTCGGPSGKAGVKWRRAATAALRRCSTILPAGAPTPRSDVAICLTDLPLHAEPVPLVAQASARRRVAMVSLPALGRWCPCPRWDRASCERSAQPFRISWAGYSPTLPRSGCRRPAGHRPSWQAGFPPFAGWSARLTPGNWATSPRGGSDGCGC
jgi:hypothetical protein